MKNTSAETKVASEMSERAAGAVMALSIAVIMAIVFGVAWWWALAPWKGYSRVSFGGWLLFAIVALFVAIVWTDDKPTSEATKPHQTMLPIVVCALGLMIQSGATGHMMLGSGNAVPWLGALTQLMTFGFGIVALLIASVFYRDANSV